MLNIRRNLFETNSSSVHSITLCDESDFQDWKNDKKKFCVNTGEFYDEKQCLRYIKRKVLLEDRFNQDWITRTIEYNGKIYNISERYNLADQFINDVSDEDAKEAYDRYLEDEKLDVPITYTQYYDYMDEWYETYEDTHTTKDGSTVVAFGYFGHD